MTAKIIHVGENDSARLYEYCADYARDHDSSYVPGRDFEISPAHPSYLLLEGGEVVGAVSLMRTERFRSVGKARFSIFHARKDDLEMYTRLLEAIRPHIQDLTSAYLFIPETKQKLRSILESLGFQIERYSFILERRGGLLPEPVFPNGISVEPLKPEDLAGISQFAECLNKEFKNLAGHTPSTTDDIRSWFDDESYLDGGLCLLKKGDQPIGTIVLMKDLDDSKAGEIMGFGILEEFRGLNLGRSLFRYGFNFLRNEGLDPVVLSVNGENHNAIRLYQSEGFQLVESVVCYSLAGG